MEIVLAIVSAAIQKGPELLSAFIALLTVLIGFFMLIPGEQPEKFLQSVVDFLSKFSKK